MKNINYIFTGVLLIAFTGCGSSGTEKKDVIISQDKEIVTETSPKNAEKSKTPPAIPNI